MLADLDRPIERYHYEPWGMEIPLRAISAAQFVDVMNRLAAAGEDNTAAKIAVMSAVCSCGVTEPIQTPEEWAAGVSLETLMHLGNYILAKSSKSHSQTAKKN